MLFDLFPGFESVVKEVPVATTWLVRTTYKVLVTLTMLRGAAACGQMLPGRQGSLLPGSLIEELRD